MPVCLQQHLDLGGHVPLARSSAPCERPKHKCNTFSIDPTWTPRERKLPITAKTIRGIERKKSTSNEGYSLPFQHACFLFSVAASRWKAAAVLLTAFGRGAPAAKAAGTGTRPKDAPRRPVC